VVFFSTPISAKVDMWLDDPSNEVMQVNRSVVTRLEDPAFNWTPAFRTPEFERDTHLGGQWKRGD
jgi:hypothetical protein